MVISWTRRWFYTTGCCYNSLEATKIPGYKFYPINSLFFVNSYTGWAVGDGGTILKYTGENISGLINSDFAAPTLNQISAFPNPIGISGMNISFSLKHQQFVTVKIYNSIGQEVHTLFNGLANEGERTFFWKPDGLASGMYFVSVNCKEFTHVQKCIFIHK